MLCHACQLARAVPMPLKAQRVPSTDAPPPRSAVRRWLGCLCPGVPELRTSSTASGMPSPQVTPVKLTSPPGLASEIESRPWWRTRLFWAKFLLVATGVWWGIAMQLLVYRGAGEPKSLVSAAQHSLCWISNPSWPRVLRAYATPDTHRTNQPYAPTAPTSHTTCPPHAPIAHCRSYLMSTGTSG